MKNMKAIGAIALLAMALVRPAAALDSIDLSVTAHPGHTQEHSVEDDEETFFSRGSHHGVRGRLQQSVATPQVDVVATCRAVLAEGPANYHKAFFEGCRSAVQPAPTRRVGRKVSSIAELDA